MDIIETAVFAMSVFVLIYVFLAQPHQVSGRSMVPTFEDGDYLITNKLAYRKGMPNRGDVVIFHAPALANCPPGGACDFIKRVIGLPGEMISLRDNTIYVNGVALKEDYISSEFVTRGGSYLKEDKQIKLGNDEFFVMGDNRSGSSDSRNFGPVTVNRFVGKAWIRYWPLDKLGLVSASH